MAVTKCQCVFLNVHWTERSYSNEELQKDYVHSIFLSSFSITDLYVKHKEEGIKLRDQSYLSCPML